VRPAAAAADPTTMTAARLLSFAAILAAGCSVTAVRPPSPAAQAPPDQVAQQAAAAYPPTDRFLVAVFGSERRVATPGRCHTWATAVRLTEGGVEAVSVSWMPATLDIDPGRLRTEPGVNLSHDQSLAYAAADGQRVTGWGPYPVTPACFHRLRLQAEWLEAGAVAYQSLDTVGEAGRTGAGTNCLHALMDLRAEFGRLRYPLVAGYGATGGRWAAWRLRRFGGVVGGPDPAARGLFGDRVRWADGPPGQGLSRPNCSTCPLTDGSTQLNASTPGSTPRATASTASGASTASSRAVRSGNAAVCGLVPRNTFAQNRSR
jgi:hypothetical protein